MSNIEPEVIEAAKEHETRLKRKKLFIALAATVLTAGTAFWSYQKLYASHFVTTDNAYTGAETAQVTPAIAGIVREVLVTDTQPVRQGDILVVLDGVDARLALAQAAAD